MENPAATLHCPNHRCQAVNPQINKFCQNCRTPLVRRYLWAIASGLESYKVGEAIGDRYVLAGERILLDTQPAIPPETPQDVPPEILPYLRLSPYRLHVPQVYGQVTVKARRKNSSIWLLEDAAIARTEASGIPGQLLPELIGVWHTTPALRQLNWLWQWANLWQPLSMEGVVSSLLNPSLLRVEGSILRLLELESDPKKPPNLQQLGQFWSELIPGTSPKITQFYQQVCSQLIEGQIRSSEQLIALLDQGLIDCERISSADSGTTPSRRYQIFTLTDPGPSRSNNEDACYPPSGQSVTLTNSNALAIVCDGIGGQDAGEVASQLAIEALRDQVENLPNDSDTWNPTTLTVELEQAVCAANDLISQRNDNEQRFERQRMGTTVVMARTAAHEMYITHVGDSRVYWITRHSCHQVTQDDDLASREVRLGYSIYREAIQQPSSGALVQALGMAPSATLHPTVQRFVLDEDCVFLLCSDGLSDYDRVDQYWQTEILPILQGQIDLPTATARLLEIANGQNGHDNVTIALVYCQVASSSENDRQTELSTPKPESIPTPALSTPATSHMKTQQLPARVSQQRPWGLLLGIVFLLGLGGVIASVLLGGFDQLIDWASSFTEKPEVANSPSSADPTSTPTTPAPSPTEVSSSDTPKLIQITRATVTNSEGREIPLLLRLESPSQNPSPIRQVPSGSILQVISQVSEGQEDTWLELKVCSIRSDSTETQPSQNLQNLAEKPSTPSKTKPTSTPYRPVQPGDSGWIKEVEVQQNINPNFTPTPTQVGECTPSP